MFLELCYHVSKNNNTKDKYELEYTFNRYFCDIKQLKLNWFELNSSTEIDDVGCSTAPEKTE